MIDFKIKWVQERKEPLGESVRKVVVPQKPLKDQIHVVQQALKREITHLDNVDNRLRKKDATIMHNIVTATEKHDEQHASTHANELAETRKMARLTNQTKMVLEQISLRMETIEDMGDLATVMAPIVPVVRGIKSGLSNIMPDAGSAIGEIGDMMNGLLTNVGNLSGSTLSFEPGSEDAEKIMAEAMAVAEQKRMEKFPQVPNTSSGGVNFGQPEQS
jgi:division protein CdvB (Snf7/Vps24/ESCRT-III family)